MLLPSLMMKMDELYLKYRDDLEKYVTQEVIKGNHNKHLRIVYSRVLTDDFIMSCNTAYTLTMGGEKPMEMGINITITRTM